MSLKCEPFSEPLHIFAEWLFGGGHRALARELGKLLLDLGPVVHLVQLVRVERHPQPARPVHRIITMIQWIRTSRLSIKHSLSDPQPVVHLVQLVPSLRRLTSSLTTYWSESTLSS